MRSTTLAVLFCALSASLFAADFWVKKDYTKWSSNDCQHLLDDSPWARTKTLSTPANVQPRVTVGGVQPPSSPDVGGEISPSISYDLQFRSAKPVREAIVREAQIQSHYDKMTGEQKAAFDANAAKYISQTFSDKVVVAVVFTSNVSAYETDLRNYWDRQTAATLHETVFLNAAKERLQLIGYSQRDNVLEFVFPRPRTALQPDDLLSVEFVHPTLRTGLDTSQQAGVLMRLGEQRMLFEFKPGKMLLNGQLEF